MDFIGQKCWFSTIAIVNNL